VPKAREVKTAELDGFADAWTAAVVPAGFVPMSVAQVRQRLLALSRQLAEAMLAEPFAGRPGEQAGAALVEAHLTDPEVLRVTLQTMGERLCGALEAGDLAAADVASRLGGLQAAVATGYARALRDATMADQEQLTKAVLDARVGVEKELRASEARFRAIFAGAAIGIGIADMSGGILRVNQAFADLLGYTPAEMRRLTVTDLTHPEDPPGMWELYGSVVQGERDHVRMEKAYFRKDGAVVWTDLTVSLVRDEAGRPSFTVAMVDDVTDRHRLQAQLRHQALHDPLTGLPNRTMVADRLAEAFSAVDPATRVGLCYLDLDGFKQVNDTLGHDVGDQLLTAVAARLDEALSGAGRLLARMGGDEFILVVQPSSGIDELSELADTALRVLSGPLWAGRHRLRVSASIGVVEREIGQSTAAELLKAADVTLYEAKAAGRGRLALYDAMRNAREVARFELAAELPDALERGEFVVVYQPMVELDGETVSGVEALLRWRHPRLGVLHPDSFVALAEESGLIVPLGRWVLQTACVQAAQWRRHFPDRRLLLSVNVAVVQAHEPTLADDVAAILAETGLPADLLQLEVTESAVMDASGPPLKAMWDLTTRGVRVAIDDFGTGYSNLASLRNLPVHTLKLAGSFIGGLSRAEYSDPVDEQIVGTVVRLAHALGLTVTAEGIETPAQAERLRALGCDTGQGWHFARPQDAEAVTALLARERRTPPM
jgi:diguanylate cyclase (GGDEF)-like protein/PAS domain S-box-containing protein